jgi:hypothetical protein
VQVKDKSGPQRFERQIVDNGEADKRLFVVESEFGSVLQQSGRDGNILSAILRDAWDGKPLRVLARSNKDSCQKPHITMLGNVTVEELQRLLTTNDKAVPRSAGHQIGGGERLIQEGWHGCSPFCVGENPLNSGSKNPWQESSCFGI